MNTKLAIFDVDGVINNAERFSLRLSRKQNLPIELINEFFSDKFQLCLIGKLDLKIELEKIKHRWNWKNSVDELINFWFEGENNINTEVLELISKLPKQVIKIAATNQEKYRAEYLKNKMGLNAHFSRIYSSADLGIKKPDPKFFLKISEIQKTQPNNIYFWDDDIDNVESAKKLGINSYLFSDITTFSQQLSTLSQLH